MSITDGQWILDMNVFRAGLRPAISVGLSVTRVGGVGQNERQKAQNAQVFKTLTEYNRAKEYAHFGTEMSTSTHKVLIKGNQLSQIFTQVPGETYPLAAQQLMLDVILADDAPDNLDVGLLKRVATEVGKTISSADKYPQALAQLKSQLAGGTS